MIGALSPQYISPTLFGSTAIGGPEQRVERTYVVACCGQCGNATGSARARVCDRSDCGLPARHDDRNAA